MKEISIKELLQLLRKHMVWLIILPLIAALVAGVYLYRLPNEYTAQAKLYVLMDYVDTMGQTRYDTSVSTQFVGDFKELIKTSRVVDTAAVRLGMTRETLEETVEVDVAAVAGTRILNVNATSLNAGLSMNVANEISHVFVEYIRDIMKTDTVSVAAEAQLPEHASGPARLRNTVLVFMLVLIVTVLVILAVELLNSTIRSAEELEEALEVPVLASVETYKDVIEKFMAKRERQVCLSQCVSGVTRENMKTLATNVLFASMGGPVRSIMMTSTMSTEGKSSLTLMLAETLAEDGYQVLIVDMDVRRPSIGRYVGVRNRLDMLDYMMGKTDFDKILVNTASPGVQFVDFRHKIASASQVVNYQGFDSFLDEALKRYDIVLFDTPPLGMFIDAAVLSAKVDGTLMVVGKGMVDRDKARNVVDQLHKANAHILGAVLNYTEKVKNSRYGGYGKEYIRYAQKADE